MGHMCVFQTSIPCIDFSQRVHAQSEQVELISCVAVENDDASKNQS